METQTNITEKQKTQVEAIAEIPEVKEALKDTAAEKPALTESKTKRTVLAFGYVLALASFVGIYFLMRKIICASNYEKTF